MNKIAIALVLGTVFAVGCGDKGAEGKDSKSASAGGSAKADDKKAASGGDTGIKECDDYIAEYSKCIDKMPGEAKDAAKKGLDDMKTAWKAAASGPGKDATVTACKQAAEAMKANPACK